LEITTRREMAHVFEERMTSTYEARRDGDPLDVDTNLVKAYMLEAHAGEGDRHSDVLTFLVERLSGEVGPFSVCARVEETGEESFFRLDMPGDGQADAWVTFWVDATDSRFWTLHTMGRSTETDWSVHRLITRTLGMDRAWLPVALLEYATAHGDFRGLGLDYDARQLVGGEEDAIQNVGYLKMQLWGNQAPRVLKVLRRFDAFPHQATLAKVMVKYWLGGSPDEFALLDLKFDGKVTARGTSFASHQTLLTAVYRRYAAIVRAIEDRARLAYEHESDSGWRVRGSPVELHFQHPFGSAEELCNHLFTAGPPFRLLGIPLRIASDYYTVSAVDLHVGHPIDFEVTQDAVRVYLRPQSCGNTVVRLLTNLQHSLDALAEAELNGVQLSELEPADGELGHRHGQG